MADGEILGRQGLKKARDRFAGGLGKDEGREEAGVEIEHLSKPPTSQPLVTRLAQQLGSGAAQGRHGRADASEFSKWQRLSGSGGGGQMRHGLASTGNDHFLARFHPVQKFTEAGFGLGEIHCVHDNLIWSCR